MSLNNIELPHSMLTELYKSSLVDTGDTKPREHSTKQTAATPTTGAIMAQPVDSINNTPTATRRFLGENKKNVLVIVSYTDAVFVPDNALQFFTTMLTACKLSLADVAIVNLAQHPASYKELINELKSKSALLFNIEPSAFGLPMNFPHFQSQSFAGCNFLYAPSLDDLENDKVLKGKLWTSLKKLFNL